MNRNRSSATRKLRLALALLVSPVFAVSQAPNGTQTQTAMQAPAPSAHAAAPAPKPASALLQPALDTVRTTLSGLHIDKWKKGSIRDEASTNIDSIRNDIRTNMASLVQQADTAPGTVAKLLPVSRHLDALYDVLLRVSEAARVVGPDDQATQLQQALLILSKARLALDDRIQGSADAMEKQVVDLRATIQQQAAQRAATPVPVALPCVPPPTKKPAAKTHKAAPKPATGTPAATTTTPKPQ